MSKGLFITGTGTDVGKTYITALMAKALVDNGYDCGYYKAALSGAQCIEDSDAGYVARIASLKQDKDTLISYLYKTAVSPHLAAQIEGNPVELPKVKRDYDRVSAIYDYLLVEGSGGIVCPIRHDEQCIMLIDIVKLLDIPALIVADAGLGTINSTVLTAEYLKAHGVPIAGVILNHFTGSEMQLDNIKMIEHLIGVKVVATASENAENLSIAPDTLASLFA